MWKSLRATIVIVVFTAALALGTLLVGWFSGPLGSVFLIGPLLLFGVAVGVPIYAIVVAVLLLTHEDLKASLVVLTLLPGLFLSCTAVFDPKTNGAVKFAVLRPFLDRAIEHVGRPEDPALSDTYRRPLPGPACTLAGLCEYSIYGQQADQPVIFVWNSSGVLSGGSGYGHIVGRPASELFTTSRLDGPAVRSDLGGGWWWMDTRD